MKRTHGAAAAAVSFAWLFASIPAQAQVESVVISKSHAYVQTGPTTVSLSTASNNYGFSADVNGTNIAGIPAPVVTGPINTSALGSIHNNGKLLYSAGDRGWRWGSPNANDFGTSSLASLDSFFASGTYTITVQGIAVSLVLSGDAYPNAPAFTLSGGSWSGGKYVIDASQALTLTTNAYAGYGAHKDDLICAGLVGPGYPLPFSDVGPFGCGWLGAFPHQFHSTKPTGPNFVTFTMPPYSLAGGNEYTVLGLFEAIVDENPIAGLPGSRNVAGYEVNTLLTLSVTGASGPPANGVQVSGAFSGSEGSNGSTQASFACTGTPNCVGTITINTRDGSCSNSFSWSTGVAFTGLDVTHAHSFAGVLTVDSHEDNTFLGNGSCSYSVQPSPQAIPYDGTWDGNQGTIVVHAESGDMHGTFKSSLTATPVFPMTVNGTVTPTTANISAQVQFRPQDVGTTGKVFVFALAPASKVKNAILKSQPQSLEARFLPEDDPIPCVLAQLSASGQLTGVTASNMQAYVSGVLSSQGQSVSVLNNVSTPSVAGATFFVGYGPDANTMINAGVNAPAVTVPGDLTCAPQPPQTGWWWNPAEPGRGFSIEAKGNNLFFAAFHYDPSGRATWNVSPGPTSLGGSLFTSDLYNVTGGQTLSGPYKAATAAKAGTITLAFRDASHGTMIWPGGSVPIERQPQVPAGLTLPPQTNQPESGWWWNPAESGRGFFIEWQAGQADIAGYMYDDAGNPVWYISVAQTPNPLTYSANWWTFANGQSMMGAFKPATLTSDHFAPLSITFQSATTATLTLPGGRTIPLVRQPF